MKDDQLLKKRYRIVKLLGEGTFGRVAQCKDLRNHSTDVAVKVIKAVEKYREAAVLEIKVLELIKKTHLPGRKLVIFVQDWFNYHGHMCIVFPLLGPSVFDFLKANHYSGYPMRHVRYMAYQIAKAVQFLHALKLTHTDLKPENILFVNGAYDLQYDDVSKKNVRVLRDASIQIIDLGSATFEDEHHTTIVATRHYRPLEVILELGWSYPCDVWSMGCILFELYTGVTMFMTHDNVEHLAMMERILGHLPAVMTRRSAKRKYFDECGRLKWDADSKEGKYVRAEVKPLRRHITRHDDIKELDLFDLIEEMLEYNPKKRISMADSLKHPFVSKLSSSSSPKSASSSDASLSRSRS